MGRLVTRRLYSVTVTLLAVLVLLSITAGGIVASAATAIEVLDTTHKDRFPTEVVFSLSARADTDVVNATLHVREVGKPTVTTAKVDFTPARQVSLRYAWDVQRHYIPPGVELEYYWLLEDASGNELRTEPVQLTVTDARFDWQTVAKNGVELYWYEGDLDFAAQLLDAAQGAVSRLSSGVGLPPDFAVKVFVYAGQRDLLSALRPSVQEWTGGQAFVDQGIVVAAIEPSRAGLDYGVRVIPHELTHVAVHALTKNPYGDIPRWLDEGLAVYAEGEPDEEDERVLAAAIRDNKMISVQSLSANFPADPDLARLSYAESASLVRFIIDHYGPDRLQELLAVFQEGATYDDALTRALGVDTDGLEEEWRQAIGAPPADEAAVASTFRSREPNWPALGLTGLASLVTIVALTVQARRRRYT